MKILGPITDAQDAVTKAYADALSTGGASVRKAPVRAIGLVNMNLTNPGTVMCDEVFLAVNDRFALANQTVQTENGIYVFMGSATPPVRASDFNTSSLVAAGAFVYATEGLEMRGKEVYFYPSTAPVSFVLGADTILDVIPSLVRRVALNANSQSNATANTVQVIGNLVLSLVRGLTYRYKLFCVYSANATATGSRWGVALSASSQSVYGNSSNSLTTTTRSFNEGFFDTSGTDLMPASSNATSANTVGNIATAEGMVVMPLGSARTISGRFASEGTAGTITAVSKVCYLEVEPIL